jgi:hypothetical protein
MSSPEQVDGFVRAFAAHWEDAVGGFESVMHPGATLWVAGAPEPLPYEEADGFVRAVKRAIPDIRLEVLNWAARGDQVFTEWEMTGTIGGKRVVWRGINRNTLDGAKSRGAISCWDRYALLRQVAPEMPDLDLGAELARAQNGT